MVINKMTFPSKRDDRIPVYVSILDSLVSMLNEALPRRASERQVRSGARSRFQNALRVHFDSWIEKGKLDPSPKDEYPCFTLRHQVGNNGIAQYFLDFDPQLSGTRPLKPEHEALMWFRLFLTIEGRRLLSRCSKCGRYFLRKRIAKGGQQPNHDDFCPEHRSQPRIQSMKASREGKLNLRIKAAAILVAELNSKKRMKQWKKWVAQKFNENLNLASDPIFMTPSWITRHMKKIQSEMADQLRRDSNRGGGAN
jgi:hypothetical protein